MKTLRAGVSRLREELAALLGVEVAEVAGPRAGGADAALPAAPVLIGTEAVLHRVRHAAAVAFLDIDLHLLAPRLSATEDTLALFVRAARLVGPRGTGAPSARVQVQTRVPEHPLLTAVSRGEPAAVLAEEVARAARLGPAAVRRAGAGVRHARRPTTPTHWPRRRPTDAEPVSVAPLGEDRFLLRASTHGPLCDLLARVPRPPGRGLRVEVDPATL